MGTKTALQIVNAALQELGLPQAQTAISSLDDQTGFQSLGLLNALGSQLYRAHDWHFLEKTAEIAGDGIADSFPLPADFGRIVNQTEWSSGMRRPMIGPQSSQSWAWVQYGIVSVGVYYRYRIIGSNIHIYPKLAAGEKVNFYYITDRWAINSADSTPKTFIDSDSDRCVFDDYLMISGIKYKLWSAKGMDSVGLYSEFMYMLNNIKAQSQGAPVVSLPGVSSEFLISGRNVPDGGWNV